MSTPVTPRSTSTGLVPKELDFATPKQSSCRSTSRSSLPPTPSTPQTPQDQMSDVESLQGGQSEASSLTPDFSSLSMGKKRGRPRKKLEVPTFDDFPIDADAEEKSKYICKKTTEMWQYKKLTSKDSSEYRKQETE